MTEPERFLTTTPGTRMEIDTTGAVTFREPGTSISPGSPVIPVRVWWEVFTFNGESQLECPDCETLSEQFRDIYAAVRWVNDHYSTCPGNGNN